MIKAVIFDLDGLLIDSETAVWPKSISEFLGNKGFTYTDTLNEKTRGSGHKETIKAFRKELGLKGNEKELIGEMRSYFYKNFLLNPRLINGAKKLLNELSKKQYLLSIATGLGPRNKVVEMLNALEIDRYFKAIITGDEVKRGKPNPEIYLSTAKELEVQSLNCLVLEDAVNGVLAGKRAGMKVFGVNKDEEIRKKLRKAGADKVFSSLLEIKDI